MTAIDATQRLAVLLRTQAFASATRPRGKRAEASPAQQQAPDLASVVARRIHSIAPDDPDRKRKALRMLLEVVLLDRLGAALATDPSFPDMLDAVQQQMQADGEVAAAVDALSNLLLAGRPAR